MMKRDATTVYVENITGLMKLGIHQFEKERSQSISVSIRLHVDPESRKGLDDIEDAVSYSEPVKEIRRIMSEEQIDLVETFAEKIGKICFEDVRVNRVFVRICKNNIIPDSTGAGVEMEFSR